MYNNVVNYFYGKLEISVATREFGKFLNMCRASGILLMNVKQVDDIYTMNISLQDFWKLRNLLKKTHTKVRVLKKTGFPFLMQRYRKRLMFPLGILVSIIIIYMLSLHIWSINFNGNMKYTDTTLYSYMKERGISEGTQVNEIDCEQLEMEIRKDFPYITWVSVEIKGTKLNIYVKENIILEEDEAEAEYEFCDLVSEKDSTIVSIITRGGVPLVKKGDVVKPGDILITGKVEVKTEYDEPLRTDYVEADGTIIGETQYLYEDRIVLEHEEKVYTGNTCQEYYLKVGDTRISSLTNNKFEKYDTIYMQSQYMLSENIYTPLYYGEVLHKEYEYVTKKYTTNEATGILQMHFDDFLSNFNKNGVQIIEKDVTIEEYEDCLVAKGTVTVHEPLGNPVPIYINEEELINEHN